jgi:hypothetical protein
MLWEENQLAHYGVKGMRWGVRKIDPSAGVPYRTWQTPTSVSTNRTATPVSTSGHVYGNTVPMQRQNATPVTAPAKKRTTGQTRGQLLSIQSYLKTSVSKDERAGKEDTTGQFGRGNIDLNKRRVVKNKDGTISTEKSFSVNIDGKETLLPTVINGKIVSEDEAIDHYIKTGEHLGQFDTVEEAEKYAEELHNRQDWYYNTYLEGKGGTGNVGYDNMIRRRAAAKAAGKGVSKNVGYDNMMRRRREAEEKKKQKKQD